MELMEKHFAGLWFLPGKNRGRYPHCHSLFLPGPGILIDPACDRQRLRDLRQQENVRAVWLSHWHEDHFKDLDLFDDLPLFVSQEDSFPLSGMEQLLTGYDPDSEFPYWSKVMDETFHFRPRTPAGFLAGGEVLHFEGITVEIIATPGHTPGHLAFYFPEPQILFLGDYTLSLFGPWYGDYSSDIEATIQSLRRLRSIPAMTWIVSHGTGILEGVSPARWDRYEGIIYKREKKILKALDTCSSLEEILEQKIMYGWMQKSGGFYAEAEKAVLVKHLEYLLKQGKISERHEHYLKNSEQRVDL